MYCNPHKEGTNTQCNPTIRRKQIRDEASIELYPKGVQNLSTYKKALHNYENHLWVA